MDDVKPGDETFGDVGLCWIHQEIRGEPHHAFMLVPGPDGRQRWMVHWWMEVGRVSYNPYSSPWTENTHSFFQYRGLD